MSTVKNRIGWLEFCFLLAVLSLIGQSAPYFVTFWNARPRPGHQTTGRVATSIRDGKHSDIQYLIYLPQDYTPDHVWPLLLFLHGSAECGDDPNDVLRFGPPKIIAEGKQLPMIVVSPQCRPNESWNSGELLMLLDSLERNFSVDRDRVYACGFSMGGDGVWDLISTAPERFAAAVPVCGRGHFDDAERVAKVPIWAFHGAHDDVIPAAASQQMVEAVLSQRGNAKLTIYVNEGHMICDLTFNRGELYDWLLTQHRAGQSTSTSE